jgi:hypothetical protein
LLIDVNDAKANSKVALSAELQARPKAETLPNFIAYKRTKVMKARRKEQKNLRSDDGRPGKAGENQESPERIGSSRRFSRLP